MARRKEIVRYEFHLKNKKWMISEISDEIKPTQPYHRHLSDTRLQNIIRSLLKV